MNKKSSTQAVLALMQDEQKFRQVKEWPHATVKFYSDYIDAEYHIRGTIRDIPDNNADEWRMYASDDVLVLVFTYYHEED